MTLKKTIVYNPDFKPMFPGGPAAYMRYLNKEFKYPKGNGLNEMQTSTMADFIVDVDGTILKPRIVNRFSKSGLTRFDIFKKKSFNSDQADRKETTLVDNNSYLLETLKNTLVQLGYQVDRHPQYLALVINAEIKIATVIIDNPNNHPYTLQLCVTLNDIIFR